MGVVSFGWIGVHSTPSDWEARTGLPATSRVSGQYGTVSRRAAVYDIRPSPALSPRPTPMELPIILVNFLYAILGVVLMYASYRIIDALTPEMDFREELKRGNIAVAIFIAALFLSIAIVVAHALN